MVRIKTHLSTCFKSDSCARAGVPETAHEEIRGMSDTISLQKLSGYSCVGYKYGGILTQFCQPLPFAPRP